MTCICKSSRELSEEEMQQIANRIGCSIRLSGKVMGENRWDYVIETPKHLDPVDRKLISNYGLEVFCGR